MADSTKAPRTWSSLLLKTLDDAGIDRRVRRNIAIGAVVFGIIGSYVTAYTWPVLTAVPMVMAIVGGCFVFRGDLRWRAIGSFFGVALVLSPAMNHIDEEEREEARQRQVRAAAADIEEAERNFRFDLPGYDNQMNELQNSVYGYSGSLGDARLLSRQLRRNLEPLTKSRLREDPDVRRLLKQLSTLENALLVASGAKGERAAMEMNIGKSACNTTNGVYRGTIVGVETSSGGSQFIYRIEHEGVTRNAPRENVSVGCK